MRIHLGRNVLVVVVMCLAAVAIPAVGIARATTVPRSYHTPGYRWNHKLPKVAPVVPGKPVMLGDGEEPRLLVDAAGTGEVAWTSGHPGETASTLHECVLHRGQSSCSALTATIPPVGTANPIVSDIDESGPIPLQVGNQLLLLTRRCCGGVALPDGSSGDPDFLYTSDDGGKTFTGPGIVNDTDINGGAVAYGGNSPQIGIVTQNGGGTYFSGTPAGAYSSTSVNLDVSLSASDGSSLPEAYHGSVAVDGTEPIVAFDDGSDTFVREYNGTGNIDDPSSWSVARIKGDDPQVVAGPHGAYLLYDNNGALMVQRLVRGQPSGAPSLISPADATHTDFQITEDAGGRLTAGWFADNELVIRTSTDSHTWSALQPIATHVTSYASNLALGAAQDGGGFATFEIPETTGVTGSQIEVVAFGAISATGVAGLGDLTGGGLGGLGGDPNASASCTDVHFGDIDALAEGGCFLRDPRNPIGGAAEAEGEIRLNGLEIIPDAGVEIVIDPRQHTINTTGSVSVVLRTPLIGDITLYHGGLNLDLPGSLADAGQKLVDLSNSAFSLEGFPINGSINIQIEHDSVVIPMSLKLPDYFLGITGEATLLANNATGFQLSSLHIGVPDLVLGALEIKDLNIDYTEQGDMWAGSATLNIPAGSPYFGIAVAVQFDHGDFTMGSFNVTVPFPGVPIFTDTYLDGFGGGFDIHPADRRFFGSVTIGAIPLDPPNYTIGVTGTVSITFINGGPVIVEVDGDGTVHGYDIANGKLIFQTNGYFEVDGNVDIDLEVAELKAGIQAIVDLPSKEFSASFNGELLIAGHDIVSAQAVVSSLGVAACGSVGPLNAGFSYPWGGTPSPSVGLDGCDISPYVIQPMSAVAGDDRARGTPGARERVAVVRTTSAAPFEDIAVTGAGAPPSVILHGPNGQSVTPVALGTAAAASAAAVALPSPKNDTTYVMVRTPGAGSWTVSAAAGSSTITAVEDARGYAPPKITAHVAGHGTTRHLSYSVTTRPGLSISFAEKAKRTYHVLGRATSARGTLRFAPAPGTAGKRTIDAIVSDDGVQREIIPVTSYHAPGPATPGKVHSLRVTKHGNRFHVRFGNATGSSYYDVTVTASDGRHLLFIIRRGSHSLTFPVLGYSDHLTVKVVAVSPMGKRSPAASARA